MAIAHVPASEELLKTELLSNRPVQARSNQRLTALLDATARVTHAKGYENLTTADVAEAAGASIGTVYRYFTDRVKILKALAVRNFEIATKRFFAAAEDDSVKTVAEAIAKFLDMYIDLFRNEPGFRSLRFGDVLDVRAEEDVQMKGTWIPRTEGPRSQEAAKTMSEALQRKFNTPDNAETRLMLEKTLIVIDALLDRAFRDSDEGDPVFIEAARSAALELSRRYV